MKMLVKVFLATGAAINAQQAEFTRQEGSTGHIVFAGASSNLVILDAQIAGGPLVRGAPYSAQAITDVTQALADGNRIETHSSSMRYRDTQGRERREDVLPVSAGRSPVFIWDPVSRTSVTLDQTAHTAQQFGPFPPAPPAHGGSLGVVYPPPAQQADVLTSRGLNHGALVTGTAKGSPAEKAGIRNGDVILAVDGQSVKDSDDLRPRILAVPVGSSVTLNLDREGNKMDIPVTLQDRSQVFADMPSALGGPPIPVYVPFVQVAGNDRSTTKTDDLGTMTLQGLLAEGKRSTMTIPAGQVGNTKAIDVITETWYSPELQTMLLVKHSDPRTGDTTYRLTNISRGEPPASLFQVPPHFTLIQSPGPSSAPAK